MVDDARRPPDSTVEGIYGDYRDNPAKRRAWDATNPGNQAIRGEVESALAEVVTPLLQEGGRLLDAGCGGGFWLRRLLQLGFKPELLYAVDLIPNRAEAARRVHPAFVVHTADIAAMPFPGQYFDGVLLFNVLSSHRSAAAVCESLTEVSRVLSPGGVAVCWEPRVSNPLNRATKTVSPHVLEQHIGPCRRFTTLTLLPSLARRLGPRTGALYPRLTRVPLLRTHWFGVFERRVEIADHG